MKKKQVRPRKEQEVFPNVEEKERTQTQGDVLKEAPPPVAVLPLTKAEPVPDKPSRRSFAEKPEASDEQRIAESRESLKQTLVPDQKFFETPDGEIIIGESDKNQVWSRRINGGHGGWVNPMR